MLISVLIELDMSLKCFKTALECSTGVVAKFYAK